MANPTNWQSYCQDLSYYQQLNPTFNVQSHYYCNIYTIPLTLKLYRLLWQIVIADSKYYISNIFSVSPHAHHHHCHCMTTLNTNSWLPHTSTKMIYGAWMHLQHQVCSFYFFFFFITMTFKLTVLEDDKPDKKMPKRQSASIISCTIDQLQQPPSYSSTTTNRRLAQPEACI